MHHALEVLAWQRLDFCCQRFNRSACVVCAAQTGLRSGYERERVSLGWSAARVRQRSLRFPECLWVSNCQFSR